MKKTIIPIITLLLSVVLAACAPVTDTTDDKTPVSSSPSASLPTNSESSGQPEAAVSIAEQVIYEQDGIRVTALSLEQDNIWGPSVKVLIENDSEQNITVQTRNCSVNDLMTDPMFSCDVASGKKANDSITLLSSSLEAANITTIQKIEFSLYIFNTDSWEEIATSETITLTTSADPAFVQTYDDSGFVAYDDSGIKIVIQKLNSSDSFWGSEVYVYAENNTGSNITIQARDVSINGFMVDPAFSCDIVAGKKAYDTITFFESDLEENSITDITELEIKFYIFSSDSWEDIHETDAITVTFE